MEIFRGLMNEHSDRVSDKYISVNNFGYYRNTNKKIHTLRKNGRCDYQLMYIDRGSAIFKVDGTPKKIASGTVILYRPFERQEYTFDVNSTFYWIHFSGKEADNLLKELKLEGMFFNTPDFFAFKEAFEKMTKDSTISDTATEQLLCANMIYMLSLVSRKTHTSNNVIYKVLEKMQTDFQNRLTNKDYAKICGVSEYHFIRKFKAETGLTPLQYKTKIVINKAIDLLETTNLNISEISRMLGFEDSLYFSRVFKKEMGIAPREYMKNRKPLP